MAAAEGAAGGESKPTASGQGGPTAPCYWPDASGRSSTGGGGGGVGGQEMPAACGQGERTDICPEQEKAHSEEFNAFNPGRHFGAETCRRAWPEDHSSRSVLERIISAWNGRRASD